MTRVEQGILINNQHLENVLNNLPEEISFKDQILTLGYNNIEEFFEEKAIYEMQQVLKNNLISITMEELPLTLNNLIQNHQYGIISIYTDKTCVCHGDNIAKPLNTLYCKENNIPIYPYNSFGGNIVATAEDYGMVFIIPSSIDITEKLILNRIVNILNQYFNNVEIQGNDILINNKKVIGSGSFGNQNIFFMLFYFSMSDKGELIYNICGEPTTDKLPGYIDSNVLPLNILREELLSWLQGL